MNNNEAIIARIKGIPAQKGTPESDADPRNPNISERNAAIEQCAQIAETMTDTADGSGEIYIARKIADEIRKLLPQETGHE
jgi:hypothetical protein